MANLNKKTDAFSPLRSNLLKSVVKLMFPIKWKTFISSFKFRVVYSYGLQVIVASKY